MTLQNFKNETEILKMSKNQKANNKKTQTKKTTTKTIDIEKINITKMSDIECEAMKNHLLAKLKSSTIRRDKCRIRQQLRKYCQHFGGMRNRTYVDKTTNERHIVERENATNDVATSTK
jgi:hypothetical protein